MASSELLHFEGCNFFRLRIAYSLLSGRPVVISNIRPDHDDPGVKEHETNLLMLIDHITNGSRVDISKTGTTVRFTPGVLLGGEVSMDCGNTRCLSFYLELLILIAPFCKRPLRAKLTGVTNAPGELSVDAMKHTWLPIFNKFVLNDEDLDIKISARGLLPDGGGTIVFTAPVVKTLRPVQRIKPGKVCKIRGTAFVAKVSPSLAHRLIESAKNALRGYIADVYITVDQRKGKTGGNSPGYGLILTARTTEGVFYHGEAMSRPKGDESGPVVPEDVGTLAAHNLLTQIYQGGCADSSAQALATTFMALGEKDCSKFLFGDISIYTASSLRLLKDFFTIVFKLDDWQEINRIKVIKNEQIKEDKAEEKDEKKEKEEIDSDGEELRLGGTNKVLLTAIGIGYSNLNKLIL